MLNKHIQVVTEHGNTLHLVCVCSVPYGFHIPVIKTMHFIHIKPLLWFLLTTVYRFHSFMSMLLVLPSTMTSRENPPPALHPKRRPAPGFFMYESQLAHTHVSHQVGKVQQRLYFLRKLKHAHHPHPLLTYFYRSAAESLPTDRCTVWFTSCTGENRKVLQQVLRVVERVICAITANPDRYLHGLTSTELAVY